MSHKVGILRLLTLIDIDHSTRPVRHVLVIRILIIELLLNNLFVLFVSFIVLTSFDSSQSSLLFTLRLLYFGLNKGSKVKLKLTPSSLNFLDK